MLVATRQKHPLAARRQGFTLIELLMVVTVILILAGITFGISRGVQNAQARAKVKAELSIIAQSLEQFKSVNGDYPWADDNPGTPLENGKQLLRALGGYMTFDTSGLTPTFVRKNPEEMPTNGPRSFIDLTRVTMKPPASELPDAATQVPEDFYFIDPWGNPYQYRYKSSATDSWERFGYVLFSVGPDGEAGTEIPNTGIIPDEDGNDEAIDNIYAGE
jgi:prepilin-type N-terminal cleavage/methylation domain-containing protein